MKKWIGLLLGVCLAVALIIGFVGWDGENPFAAPPQSETAQPDQEAAPEETPEVTPEEQVQSPLVVDYDALYAAHRPEETVLTVEGQEIPWQDYFYMYYMEASQMEDYFRQMQYYGSALGWESQADEEGHSFAQLVPIYAEDSLRQLITIETMAEQHHIQLTQAEEAEMQERHQQNIAAYCGEDGMEEDFFAYLETLYLSPELYWRMTRANYLYQEGYLQRYGENGELLNEQEALAFLEDNQILSANHILLATVDLNTGEALDVAAVEEKAALAQKIAEELQVIEDTQARIARFLELKEQHSEDPGDFIFAPGAMVPAFEEGTRALEAYQVSDPVETEYGYHIILRRPLDLAGELVLPGGYVNGTARAWAANQIYGQQMQMLLDSLQVEPVNGFEVPVLLDFAHREELSE